MYLDSSCSLKNRIATTLMVGPMVGWYVSMLQFVKNVKNAFMPGFSDLHRQFPSFLVRVCQNGRRRLRVLVFKDGLSFAKFKDTGDNRRAKKYSFHEL